MLLYTTTYYIIQLSSFTRGEMKWVGGFGVQGSGLWWRLRRDPSTQVAAVLAFVISHTTFLVAQDDETGRCPKVCGWQVSLISPAG